MNFKKGLIYLFEKKTTAVAIFLITVLGLIIYANSLTGQFIWDDEYLVQKNILIRSWSNLPNIFTNDIGAGGSKPFNYYRPLHIASYIIDYSLWGLNVIGYHLTSIMLHILVTLCLYWFVLLLYNDKRLSLLASILFLTTPIHVETVASISVRGDLLSGLFILLCFIFYIRSLHENKINLYILTFLSYILALLSKESGLILPVLLLLYHYAFKEKIKLKLFIPIIIIACLYILLYLTVLKSTVLYAPVITTMPQRIPGFFAAIINYLRLLAFPFDLHAEYGKKLFSFAEPGAILGVIVSFLLLIYAFRKKKTNGLVFFSIYWFFITLLPVSNLYPLAFYMTEHWLYLPSIGFFLLLAYGINNLLEAQGFKALAAILITILIIFYSYLTIKQNDYWKDSISFFERTLKYAPDSAIINNNLGTLYTDMGKYEEAINSLNKAIKSDPSYIKAYNNLGNVYYNMGDEEKAMSLYKESLEIDPNYEEAYYNLGILYNDGGAKEKAIELFKKVIEINPEYVSAYNNLAAIYMNVKKYDDAITLLNNAIKINPYHAKAYYNLSLTYFLKGQYKLAIEYCDKAEALGFSDPEFLKDLERYRKQSNIDY